MTPTLIGRWQSRLFLLSTFGFLTTIPFVLAFGSLKPLLFLLYVLFFGFFWDIFYNAIQALHWDRDWPAVFQFGAGVFEGIVIAIFALGLGFDGPGPAPSFIQFFIHYASVWLVTFAASQSFMRIFFPRWRFHGGRIWLNGR